MVETASSIAESYLYVYLGLSALTIEGKYVFPSLITVVLFGTIIARMISVMLPMVLLHLYKNWRGKKMRLQWNETMLVAIGGIIRGAIAFGLALQMNTENVGILRTTTQVIVLLTTVVLGSTMGLIAKCLNIQSD